MLKLPGSPLCSEERKAFVPLSSRSSSPAALSSLGPLIPTGRCTSAFKAQGFFFLSLLFFCFFLAWFLACHCATCAQYQYSALCLIYCKYKISVSVLERRSLNVLLWDSLRQTTLYSVQGKY